MKGFYIQISNGLLNGHKKHMGSAVWEFMWLLDKITKVDESGEGYILGGKPLNLKDIASDLEETVFTASRNLAKLQKNGYIAIKHTPYGLIITVFKAKKRFAQNVKPLDRGLTKVSNPVAKMSNLIRQDNRQDNKKEINKEKEIRTLLTEEIFPYWNQKYGTQYKSPEAVIENASHWLSIYSVDDVKLAISKIKYHKFWKDKMTPTMFFRRMGKNREKVDYISDLINVSDDNRFSMIPGM